MFVLVLVGFWFVCWDFNSCENRFPIGLIGGLCSIQSSPQRCGGCGWVKFGFSFSFLIGFFLYCSFAWTGIVLLSGLFSSRHLGSSSTLSKFDSPDTDVAGSDLNSECPVGSLVHLGFGDSSGSGAEKPKHLPLNIMGLV